PQQPETLAVSNFQVYAVDGDDIAEALVEAGYGEGGHWAGECDAASRRRVFGGVGGWGSGVEAPMRAGSSRRGGLRGALGAEIPTQAPTPHPNPRHPQTDA